MTSTPQPIVPTGAERRTQQPYPPDAQPEEWIDGAQDQDADEQGPISADNEPDDNPDAQREALPPA